MAATRLRLVHRRRRPGGDDPVLLPVGRHHRRRPDARSSAARSRFDAFAMFITITICVAVVLVALVTDDYLRREELDGPEVYALYLLAAIGGIVMASANDLIVLFLGLEILSIAFYVLAASHRSASRARRAASSTSCSAASRRRSSSTASRWSTAAPAPPTSRKIVDVVQRQRPRGPPRRVRPRRRRAADRRPRLQDRRRAVPLLDARRVPGRADAGDGVHGLGRQGRRVRGDAARADLRPAALARRLAPGRSGCSRC